MNIFSLYKSSAAVDKIRKYQITDKYQQAYIHKFENSIKWNEFNQRVKSGEDAIKVLNSIISQNIKEFLHNTNAKNPQNLYYFTPEEIDLEAEIRENENHPQIQQAARIARRDPAAAKKLIADAVNQSKASIIESWLNYVLRENDTYANNPAFAYMVLHDIFKNAQKPNKNIPLGLNAEVLAGVYHDVDGTSAINFAKVYDKKVKTYHLSAGEQVKINEKDGWIRIPSKDNDPKNYESNVAKLRDFSQNTGWCTARGEEKRYLAEGDFWLLIEKQKAVVAVRFVGESVVEIQGRFNFRPYTYFNQIERLFDEKNFDKNNEHYLELLEVKNNSENWETGDINFKEFFINNVRKDPTSIYKIYENLWTDELKNACIEGYKLQLETGRNLNPYHAFGYNILPAFVQENAQIKELLLNKYLEESESARKIYYEDAPQFIKDDPRYKRNTIKMYKRILLDDPRLANQDFLSNRNLYAVAEDTNDEDPFYEPLTEDYKRAPTFVRTALENLVDTDEKFRDKLISSAVDIVKYQDTQFDINSGFPNFITTDKRYLNALEQKYLKIIEKKPLHFLPEEIRNYESIKNAKLESIKLHLQYNCWLCNDTRLKSFIQENPSVYDDCIESYVLQIISSPDAWYKISAEYTKDARLQDALKKSMLRYLMRVDESATEYPDWYAQHITYEYPSYMEWLPDFVKQDVKIKEYLQKIEIARIEKYPQFWVRLDEESKNIPEMQQAYIRGLYYWISQDVAAYYKIEDKYKIMPKIKEAHILAWIAKPINDFKPPKFVIENESFQNAPLDNWCQFALLWNAKKYIQFVVKYPMRQKDAFIDCIITKLVDNRFFSVLENVIELGKNYKKQAYTKLLPQISKLSYWEKMELQKTILKDPLMIQMAKDANIKLSYTHSMQNKNAHQFGWYAIVKASAK